MKRFLTTAAALAAAATTAQAGGVERSTQSVAILFEQGRYAELSFGNFSPDVSGTAFGRNSGDMSSTYNTFSLGYKMDIGDRMALAVIIDEPIGADVAYPGVPGATSYALAGTTADLESLALTALLRYKFVNNFSVHGGLRIQRSEGTVNIKAPGVGVADYRMSTSKETDAGYVVGIAWEKPEIAARVALTYNSAITHDLQSTETGLGPTLDSNFETEVPQSVNLEFQTGVAKDTLLFGSIRWVDWSEFTIAPPRYVALVGNELVDYPKDRVTYNLGIGRRFSDQWSGAATIGYEASDGEQTGNLGPTDGATSFGLAATYTMDAVKITAGVRYVDIGDATTEAPLNARFTNNDGIGVGIRIGYSF
jgi:long-subunit fatty acid transport protein